MDHCFCLYSSSLMCISTMSYSIFFFMQIWKRWSPKQIVTRAESFPNMVTSLRLQRKWIWQEVFETSYCNPPFIAKKGEALYIKGSWCLYDHLIYSLQSKTFKGQFMFLLSKRLSKLHWMYLLPLWFTKMCTFCMVWGRNSWFLLTSFIS